MPVFVFDGYELDTDAYELRRSGVPAPIEPQVFDVLAYLVAHRERVVTRAELLDAVWKTAFVSDAALATRIKQARQAVGDDGQSQRVIRTVHGRGYRFVAPALERAAGAVEMRDLSRPVSAAPRTFEQEIRFCTSPDGTRIAFATSGNGPPFVKTANWLSHLELDAESPVWRHFLTDLVPDFRLVRYDQRACGLSDWDVGELGVDAWALDLHTVVETLGLERFPLLGISQGGAVAVAYAVQHPERVSHLILHGSYARGRNRRGPAGRAEGEALATLVEQGWGKAGAFAQMFSARLIPRGTPEQVRWLTELQRASASTENAVRLRRAFSDIGVEHLLARVRVPTLVLHSRGDQAAPFEEGRRLAAGIPGARLVPLDSDNHLLLEDEPAWQQFRSEVRRFVGCEE